MTIFIISAVLCLAAGAALYRVCRVSFGAVPRRIPDPEAVPDEPHRQYYRTAMLENIRFVRGLSWEPVSVRSQDGLALSGKYYPNQPGRPVILLFHGFRSSALRDCAGAFRMFWESGYHILLIDQRGHGDSEGRTITLGVREQYDCLAWAEFAAQRFGPETPIVLMGISMGGAAVLTASDLDLPNSVKAIIADCGFSSPEAMIRRELQLTGYPRWFYGVERLAARLFGGFDPESASPKASLRRCRFPVLLLHGETDHYVPCEMSRENYDAIPGPDKQLVTIPDAGHGVSIYRDPERYCRAVREFCETYATP